MTETTLIYDKVAVAQRLLNKFKEKDRFSVEEFLNGLPEDISKDVLGFLLEKEMIHIVDGTIIKAELERQKLSVVCANNLKDITINSRNWYVENLIPEKSIVMLAGKRASYKSWGAMHISLAIATGKLAFNKFKTTKASVLYIDEENGIETIKERVERIAQGMDININELDNLFFASFEGIKIEREEWREKIKNFLSEHNPCIVIADAFRRIISTEENDATDVNRVFTEMIRPIAQEFNCSFILIHHLRKGISGHIPDDILDELRGSSEITNYADVVLVFDKKPKLENRFILRQAKCRRSKEQQPQIIELEWDENSVKFNCVGTAEEILDSIDLCSKAIMIWLEENNINDFKTKDVKEVLKPSGYSRATITRSLDVLTTQGKIRRIKRGYYQRLIESLTNYEGSENQNAQEPNEVNKN